MAALKMSQERHFGGDSMNGNRLHRGYESIRKGDYTLTCCFKDQPELREKLNTLWTIISNIDRMMSIREPSPEENENLAQECEKWCETYPVLFPTRSLTRKMMELSLVFPKFVRDEVPGMINKILRLEQEGESIHAKMNRLETKFNMILNKSKRYWLMLKEYENKLYTM